MKRVRTYPGADCNNDHQLLAMGIKLRFQKIKRQQALIRFDVQILDKYKINVNNRFQKLLDVDQEKTPNELWIEAKEVVLEVSKSKIPRAKKKRNEWISDDTLEMVERGERLKEKG